MTATPTRVPAEAVDAMAEYVDTVYHQDVRLLLRWHPETGEPDWLVFPGSETGTPASWYYSPTPVADLKVLIPDAHAVGEALAEPGESPPDDVSDAERKETARQILDDRIAHFVEYQLEEVAREIEENDRARPRAEF